MRLGRATTRHAGEKAPASVVVKAAVVVRYSKIMLMLYPMNP